MPNFDVVEIWTDNVNRVVLAGRRYISMLAKCIPYRTILVSYLVELSAAS
jgi:hypothetical protein